MLGRRIALVLLAGTLASCAVRGGDGGIDRSEGGDGGERRELIATVEERGSFSTPCGYSHSGADDPIVHPGHGGMSHRHDFFGAVTTDATSDADSLLAGGTHCRSAADHSAYWAPSVLDGGRPVEPVEMLAYYRVPVGADATRVEVPPNGLEMIAGDADAAEPQDPSVVGWACGLAEATSPVPERCPPGAELRLLLRFDPCWDGENLGSPDHTSHLAPLGGGGGCPATHPILLPELTLEIRYRTGGDNGIRPAAAGARNAVGGAGAPAAGPAVAAGSAAEGAAAPAVAAAPTPEAGDDDGGATGEALDLASGPATGGHGDVLVAWDEDHIATEVEVCLRANRRCDVVSESARLGFDHLAE